MPWRIPTLRDRRRQVAGDIAQHLPGADATVPNSVLRVLADSQAAVTHDNDAHLAYVAKMMMPDTAEGEFADRWGAIWLPNGRKPASHSTGTATVTGTNGAAVPAASVLTATVYDTAGRPVALRFEVLGGATITGGSAEISIEALTAGELGNLEEGAGLSFENVPDGVDGLAVVVDLSGGADIEPDADLISRYIARIQEPAHGGAQHDYVAWALEVPGVTRAWAAREMVGSVTVRVMLDVVRADDGGIPDAGDLDLVAAHIDALRPVTVADLFVLAPIAEPFNITIDNLANDTPEVRANIELELLEMLKARAEPRQLIYASWIREAVSAATGEDHHDLTVSNIVPTSAGHLITLGTITYV